MAMASAASHGRLATAPTVSFSVFTRLGVTARAKVTGQTTFLANQMPPTAEEIETLGLTPTYLEGIGGGLPRS